MSIVISDEILQASQLTPSEFRREIALYLFQTGRLTLGYASQLADMQPNDFRQLLKQRNIPLSSYNVEDFEVDLKNLRDLALIPDKSGADSPQQEEKFSLEQRRNFLRLPLAERKRILESQSEKMLTHYEQNPEWQELMSGDIVDY
jgi:predicted HTH domain antitoxin